MKLAFNMVMEIVLSLALLFAGIAVLMVIHICVVGRAFRDVGYPNHRFGSFAEGVSVPSRRISIEDLQKLPRFDYKLAAAASAVDCAVCLESFRAGDSCRLLPDCGHSFHSHCIDSWLLKTPVCPICRAAINPTPPTMDVHIELT